MVLNQKLRDFVYGWADNVGEFLYLGQIYLLPLLILGYNSNDALLEWSDRLFKPSYFFFEMLVFFICLL